MFASIYFVSEAAVRNLKQRAERRVSGVRSAHMSEVVAAALGFRTHAALRAALDGRDTTEASKPSNARAVQRLRQLGYNPPEDLHLLPELDRSYSPFKTYPLRKQRGVRWNGWRNLMVAAINAGLEQRLFGLSPGEDWWPGADPKNNGGERGLYRFTFDGDLSAVAVVSAISGDELAIHVLLDPRNEEVEADFNDGLDDGAACAHGWLERRLGAWIQDGGEEFSCKRAVQARVAAVKIEPHGYADQGSFIM
ncbi:hypothetical protein [Burkholderia gladioli]|uniref:hypothetical protein n=1 Tax=Burkholderia gladioli TaxID=28095 RepID=UPI001641129A|nr:hypothetical protein [Burkholderia gladioli]